MYCHKRKDVQHRLTAKGARPSDCSSWNVRDRERERQEAQLLKFSAASSTNERPTRRIRSAVTRRLTPLLVCRAHTSVIVACTVHCHCTSTSRGRIKRSRGIQRKLVLVLVVLALVGRRTRRWKRRAKLKLTLLVLSLKYNLNTLTPAHHQILISRN